MFLDFIKKIIRKIISLIFGKKHRMFRKTAYVFDPNWWMSKHELNGMREISRGEVVFDNGGDLYFVKFHNKYGLVITKTDRDMDPVREIYCEPYGDSSTQTRIK